MNVKNLAGPMDDGVRKIVKHSCSSWYHLDLSHRVNVQHQHLAPNRQMESITPNQLHPKLVTGQIELCNVALDPVADRLSLRYLAQPLVEPCVRRECKH